MRHITLISGGNFSGRSDYLRRRLLAEREFRPVVFLGPSTASALTGLATTVAGELAIYDAWGARRPPGPWHDYFSPKLDLPLISLSGGEQVLVGLAGTSRLDARMVGVDCALEHLDEDWRAWALSYLASGAESGIAFVVDNRFGPSSALHDGVVSMPPQSTAFPLRLDSIQSSYRTPVRGVELVVEDLSFGYRSGTNVFHKCSFRLSPGSIYRLCGANGAGKTTLVRLLAGVLPFKGGQMLLDGERYQPYRDGNRALAVAMQNPDDQWTDFTIAGDFRRRIHHIGVTGSIPEPHNLLAEWEARMGLSGQLEQHVLDLPRVLRKRLSWIWPLSRLLPWLVLDEPTIGQDDSAVSQLAAALSDSAAQGLGIVFISHDNRLSAAVASTELLVRNQQVVLCQ